MSRIILIPLALILLMVIATAVLLPVLVDKDALLAVATETLYDQTGATLTVAGDTDITLFPMLGMSLSDPTVTMPEKHQPQVSARSVDIGVQLLPLLAGNIEIDTLRLDGLIVRIPAVMPSAGGHRSQPDNSADTAASLALPLALNIRHLSITDARVEEVSTTTASTLLELISLQATELNLQQKPVPVTLALRLPGERVIDVDLDGTLRIDQETRKIYLDEIDVAISGATPEPVSLQASGNIDLVGEIADLQLALELGETRGNGKLRYAVAESPVIDTQLQLNLFDPALLALVGPEAATATESGTENASDDQPLPLDALRLIDTRAVLDIEQAHFGTHPVYNLHVNLRAVDGVITVSELTGKLHGGELSASVTLDATSDSATLKTRGNIKHLDLATALAAAQSDPLLTGNTSLDWHLNSSGSTTSELTAALNGPLKLTTEEVVLQGTSVEKLICQTVALTNKEGLTATFPTNTRFTTLSADIQIINGKATLNPLLANLPQIALTGNGNFDLLRQDFNATFNARLSPELEQLDHACRVSKRLTAIDWPVNCEGSVGTDPARWCRVDATKILQDLTINEGRDSLQKKASKLLNKLFNND